MKRINAPKHWLLDKLSGVWAPRPSPGPHKLRESLPIILILRNRLKYALTAREVKMIVMSRHIRVDGKVRTDMKYPCGFQDIVTINRTGEHFRLIYDVKGRFNLHRIPAEEATWKLCKIVKKGLGARAIPYVVTDDGRTIPYPDPEIIIGDTIKYDFIANKVLDISHFKVGAICMIVGGYNIGRVGMIDKIERHPGSFNIVYLHDKRDKKFATRQENVFILGKGAKSWVTLPKTDGIRYTILEERDMAIKKRLNPPVNVNLKRKLGVQPTVLPPDVQVLREKTREKKKLLRILAQDEKKASKHQPKLYKKPRRVLRAVRKKKEEDAKAAQGGDQAE